MSTTENNQHKNTLFSKMSTWLIYKNKVNLLSNHFRYLMSCADPLENDSMIVIWKDTKVGNEDNRLRVTNYRHAREVFVSGKLYGFRVKRLKIN